MRECYRDPTGGSLTGSRDDANGEGEPYVAEVMTVVRRALGRRASRKATT
jgi:hypothetical protein